MVSGTVFAGVRVRNSWLGFWFCQLEDGHPEECNCGVQSALRIPYAHPRSTFVVVATGKASVSPASKGHSPSSSLIGP
jgi:hypothetical protein